MKSAAASIVVVSSVAGLIGEPDLVAYGAAKGAARILSKSIALHCARRGYPIRCNSIHPGFTDTPMVRGLAGLHRDPARALEKLSKVAPLGRLGRPEEVAARRGLPLEDVAPARMLRDRAAAAQAAR